MLVSTERSSQHACIHFPIPLPMADITQQSEYCAAQYSKWSLLIVCSRRGRHSLFTILVKWHFDESHVVLLVAGRLAPSQWPQLCKFYFQLCTAVEAWPSSWEKAGKASSRLCSRRVQAFFFHCPGRPAITNFRPELRKKMSCAKNPLSMKTRTLSCCGLETCMERKDSRKDQFQRCICPLCWGMVCTLHTVSGAVMLRAARPVCACS